MANVFAFSSDVHHGGAFLRVFYQVYDYGEASLLVWIGTRAATFGDLSYTLPDALPASTSLTSVVAPERSEQLVKQLAKKYQRPVFCSYSLPKTTPLPLCLAAEVHLFEALNARLQQQKSA